MDVNLHHDVATGKAIRAILYLVNGTPINWYSKKQATESVAVRTAVDQIIDLRVMLMYLGFPIQSKSFMFRDNKSVVQAQQFQHPF